MLEAPLRRSTSLARTSALARMLDTALAADARLDLDTLRAAYMDYALHPDYTDWELVAKILQCDADAFLAADVAILDGLFTRITVAEPADAIGREILLDKVVHTNSPIIWLFWWCRKLFLKVSKPRSSLMQLIQHYSISSVDQGSLLISLHPSLLYDGRLCLEQLHGQQEIVQRKHWRL